jgi:hypothetical protein
MAVVTALKKSSKAEETMAVVRQVLILFCFTCVDRCFTCVDRCFTCVGSRAWCPLCVVDCVMTHTSNGWQMRRTFKGGNRKELTHLYTWWRGMTSVHPMTWHDTCTPDDMTPAWHLHTCTPDMCDDCRCGAHSKAATPRSWRTCTLDDVTWHMYIWWRGMTPVHLMTGHDTCNVWWWQMRRTFKGSNPKELTHLYTTVLELLMEAKRPRDAKEVIKRSPKWTECSLIWTECSLKLK